MNFRISFPEKTIWLYTGFRWSQIIAKIHPPIFPDEKFEHDRNIHMKRQKIISNIDVLVDGKYIDEQRDLTLAYRGSKNQHCIDVKQSLYQKKMVLYCE